MCSEMEMTPPRLSFSHDFVCAEPEPMGSHRGSHLSGSNSELEFEFSFISKNEEEPSSADELFCNGVIVPIKSRCKIQISDYPSKEKPPYSPFLRNLPPPQKTSIAGCRELEQKQRPKSFWGFKRSSSLNFESQRSTLGSISLLSRSNSTGTNPDQKGLTPKQNHRNFPEKQTAARKSSSDPPLFYYSSSSKSSAQKKIQRGFYGSYIWINPVLTLPPPYISKGTTNLFGFGSCLRTGKAKQSKKWNFFSVIG